METTRYYSKKIGALPKGCRMCVQGRKTVLFVTGVCPRHCSYCPVSEQKFQKDIIYANEWPISKFSELIEESSLCESTGAGITGGDPLCRLDRAVEYIKKLKKKFGEKYHIHLYTSLDLVNKINLTALHSSGLDEIRFHPNLDVDELWDRMAIANRFKWDVGVEIPVIPGKEKETKKLIDFIVGKVKFLNMNELELADSNANSLAELGHMSKDGISYGVKGAGALADKLLEYCEDKGINVHYCTAKLKDKVQLTKRIKRRAKNVAREYDILTKEGTLIRGVVYTSEMYPSMDYAKRLDMLKEAERAKIMKKLSAYRNKIIKKYEIPPELLSLDKRKLRILTTGAVIEELQEEMKSLGLQPAVVEEYPTWDTMIVDLELL